MSLKEFLESLGIEQGDKPDVCPECGANYPYCNWDSIRDDAPCNPRQPDIPSPSTPKPTNIE